MQTRILWTIMAAVVALSLFGCNGARELRKKLASREAKLEECLAERRTLESQVRSKDEQIEALQTELEDVKASADELRELKSRLEDAVAERKERVEELRKLVSNISGMSVESRSGGDFIVIENKILFPSGEITLTEEARGSLESVVGYLKKQLDENPNLKIRVGGHTDGEPIKASDWADNYELAAMRAHSVMTVLTDKGVPAENMFIIGFGPNRPRVEPPEPTAAVPENRRVEISIIPESIESPRKMLEQLAE